MRYSVLWHCWLGIRESTRPVKIEWWGVGVVICLERGPRLFAYGPAGATAIPNPHHLLPHLNPDWFYLFLPSVLWRCWLGGRKGIRPVKNFEWCSTGVVICLERDADLYMAQLMPLPLTVSCFSKIQIGFTFLVPADPGSPGERAVKRVCVWFYLSGAGLPRLSWKKGKKTGVLTIATVVTVTDGVSYRREIYRPTYTSPN